MAAEGTPPLYVFNLKSETDRKEGLYKPSFFVEIEKEGGMRDIVCGCIPLCCIRTRETESVIEYDCGQERGHLRT